MPAEPVCTYTFESNPESRLTVVRLAGQLDPLAAEELSPLVDDAYAAGSRRFVFDLSELDYVGSLGLRLFLGIHNRLRKEGTGAVALCCLTPPVLSILDVTRLTTILKCYATRQEAIDAVTA